MCLYPRLVYNRKYIPNKKNGGVVPPITDNRVLMVPIGCGNCMECRKQKAREWQVRLNEEIRERTNGKCVTLTFTNKSITELTKEIREKLNGEIWKLENLANATDENAKEIKKLKEKTYGYGLDNAVATLAVRRFLERYRKDNKVSLRHWLVTELGHQGTEHLHIHGIVWTDKSLDYIEKKWMYGRMHKGNIINGKYENYVNESTVNYCVKYVHKLDKDHQFYKPIVLTSAGIGKGYAEIKKYSHTEQWLHRDTKGNWTLRNYKKYKYIPRTTGNCTLNKFKDTETKEYYLTRTGNKLALPIYYRNTIYSEKEREKLWINRLDKGERYVLGVKIKVTNGEEEYFRALKEAQKLNKELGFGSTVKRWEQKKYETERRILKHKERMRI